MSSRLRLAVLFGGRSSEHEVSLRSARSVLDAIDPQRFEALAVGIDRRGQWRHGSPADDLANIVEHGEPLPDLRALQPDLVFPVLHGPHGEDGTVQGLLEVLDLPYVGSGVLASAACMDKVVQKQLIAHAAPSVHQVPWVALHAHTLRDQAGLDAAHAQVDASLRYPCFAKPANLGSSVGVEKCEDGSQLREALTRCIRFDTKVIVEQGVDAREIELAVLGNGGPQTQVSTPGEIILPPGTWYDYDTKYVNDVARYAMPAELEPDQVSALQAAALSAFEAMGCSGLARIDFFVDRQSGIAYLNELNTMPGFTSISMYPKLMDHAGVPYPELVSRLCALALERHQDRARLRVDR